MSGAGDRIFTNAKWMLFATIAQKLIMFIFNQAVIAFTSPEILGKIAIQSELFLSTILFISREGIRIGCLRYSIQFPQQQQYLVNISWIPVLLISILTFSMFAFKEFSLTDDVIVLLCYGIASVIECASEPWYNLYFNQMYIAPKLSSETFGLLAKSCVAFFCVGVLGYGTLGFGLSQIAYALSYSFVMLSYMKPFQAYLATNNVSSTTLSIQLASFLPHSVKNPAIISTSSRLTRQLSQWTDIQLLQTTGSITFSSFLKHIITEADKIILTFFATSYQQGIYAITGNYGSLVARLFFLPLEDATRLSFSKLRNALEESIQPILQNESNNSAISNDMNIDEKEKKMNSLIMQDDNYQQMKALMIEMLRIVLFFGLIIVIFGPSYIELGLSYIFRRSTQWKVSEISTALIFYCYYLFGMGMNGIIEAILQSMMSNKGFFLVNIGFFCSSVTFFFVGLTCIDTYGSVGIIIANICALVMRMSWNLGHLVFLFHHPVKAMALNAQKDEKDNMNTNNMIQLGMSIIASWKGYNVPGELKSSNDHIAWDILPAASYLLVAIGCKGVLFLSWYRYTNSTQSIRDQLVHVGIGGFVGISMLLIVFRFLLTNNEQELVANKLQRFIPRRVLQIILPYQSKSE